MRSDLRLRPEDKRTARISGYVTPAQKRRIEALAASCDLTMSDYVAMVLSGYEPKTRLSACEVELLERLIVPMDHVEKFANAMRGMSQENRRLMFNNLPRMREWYEAVRPLARKIHEYISAVQRDNVLPGATKVPKDDLGKEVQR